LDNTVKLCAVIASSRL